MLIYSMADTFFIGRINNPYMVAAASLIKVSFCGPRREIVIDLRVATREDIKEGMDIVFFEKGGI